MRRLTLWLSPVLLLPVTMAQPLWLSGQAIVSPPATVFSVSSVRIAPEASGSTSFSGPGSSTFTARHIAMKLMLQIAFNIDAPQIVAKYSWIDHAYYDLDAKAEHEHVPLPGQREAMLQHLLAERFALATHFETHDQPGYALVIAKSGVKLKQVQDETGGLYILYGGIQAASVDMSTFASMLGSPVGRPVQDGTALTGRYQINLCFAPPAGQDSECPSLFTALKEQLGLELKPQTIKVKMLVADHLERVPTPN